MLLEAFRDFIKIRGYIENLSLVASPTCARTLRLWGHKPRNLHRVTHNLNFFTGFYLADEFRQVRRCFF